MAFLRLEDSFSAFLGEGLSRCLNPQGAYGFLNDKGRAFIGIAKKLLEQHLFLHVCNVAFAPDANTLEAFASCFGKFRGPVEHTEIRVDCDYDGCVLSPLEFHNDDVLLDHDKRPNVGILQVQSEDPLKRPVNSVVKIDDIVSYLELENPNLLDRLLHVPVPMLWGKVKKILNDDQLTFTEGERQIQVPILYKENGFYASRFNLGRILYFYYAKGLQQDLEEKRMIHQFLQVARQLKRDMYLAKNDLLIFNNKRTMHSRSACSVEINQDGSFKSRLFYATFAL